MEVFPLDIIDNGILPRLPVKSLTRFKCVSKTWLALISSHEFIQRLASSRKDLFILTGNETDEKCFHVYDLATPDAPARKLLSFGRVPRVIGSCNGLLCFQSYNSFYLTIINPSTGIYRKIPTYASRECVGLSYGFGYDSDSHDYKVVRFSDRSPESLQCYPEVMRREFHVYSLRANSWEENWRYESPDDSMGAYENGAVINNSLIHWKFWSLREGKYRIRCFDICKKKWIRDVPLPDCMIMSSKPHPLQHDEDGVHFGAVDGKLYLSIKNEVQTAVDIWVMNEYRVKESWVKLFQVSDSTVVQSLRVSIVSYNSLQGRALLRTKNETEAKVFWYNVKDEAVETAEFYGVPNCTNATLCKVSLVDVPGGSQTGKARDDNDENQESSN